MAGFLLTLATGVFDVWENVRILNTLSMAYADMHERWFLTTITVARIKFLLTFGAVGVLPPTLITHSKIFPLSVRGVSFALVIIGSTAVAAGVTSLMMDDFFMLALSFALLLIVMLGLTHLFALGFHILCG